MLTKKTHNLKAVSYALFQDLTEDYSLGDSLSDSSEELFQRGKEESGYIGVFTGKTKQNQKPKKKKKKSGSQTSKDYC